jgi:8-oxo-dGTP pyrophosphatase MutT (NUDIX family)
VAAQDAGELFDLVDPEGRPLGRTKPRGLVHRDGDWHRSLHLWVILDVIRDGVPQRELPGVVEPATPLVLFQRRSLQKDTQPGALDLAVAGHLGAGETVEDALREAREEIGLDVGPTEVTRLGVRRRAHERPGVRDREIQEVFVTVARRALASFTPDADEVSALLTLPLPEAIRLATAQGEGARAQAEEMPTGSGVPRACTVTSTDLAQQDHYFAVALASIDRHLRGERGAPWALPR